MSLLPKAVKHGALALIVAGLLGVAALAGAAGNDPGKPPAKPAAKTHPASHSRSAGHRRATGASHKTPVGGASHQDAASVPGSPSPVAGGDRQIKNGPAPAGGASRVSRNSTAIRARTIPIGSATRNARQAVNLHDIPGGGQSVLAGGHRVIVERRDGSRLVAERGRPGFVQRGYKLNGHDFARRSYYDHGVEYESFYRAYLFRGLPFSLYSPGFYYPRAFYGWVYNPWPKPAAFAWGWEDSPWLAHFGYYFAPYPEYSSATFWLTDYLISQDLQASFVANQEGGEEDGIPPQLDSASRPPVLTPEMKQKIANEVKDQLALENQEATETAANQDVDPGFSGIARLLSDGRPHVFVAGGNLEGIDTSSGQPCVISDGDTLELQTQPPADAITADLIVLSSKGKPECDISQTVHLQLTDLQQMQNHMRETIDQGLKILQDKQGTDGLPAAPPSALTPPAQPQYAAVAPLPDPKDIADIQQQDQQAAAFQGAGQVSGDVVQPRPTQPAKTPAPAGGAESSAATAGPAIPAPADAAAAPAPPAIQIGQTIDQVEAALGAPTRIAHQKSGTVFYYNGKTVTFKDGKVINVE
jgi:hypothetical protein